MDVNFLFKHPIVRFVCSGAVGAFTNIALLYILTELFGLYYIISGIFAFSCAVIVSFILQKKWTFGDNSANNIHKKFALFVSIAIINLLANTYLLYFFTDICHFHYIFSQILSCGIVAIWSYFLYKIVFQQKAECNTAYEKTNN